MLAKEIVFVIAVQFSRGKEIREQGYYYETIAMSIQIGKRLGQGRNEVGKGGTNNSPGAESLYGGAESFLKSPSNVTRNFFTYSTFASE